MSSPIVLGHRIVGLISTFKNLVSDDPVRVEARENFRSAGVHVWCERPRDNWDCTYDDGCERHCWYGSGEVAGGVSAVTVAEDPRDYFKTGS